MSSSAAEGGDTHGVHALGSPHAEGATRLSADELEQLLPSWVTTRAELNAEEQANIARALASSKWRRKHTPEQLLDDLVLRRLHKDMKQRATWWRTPRSGSQTRRPRRSMRPPCASTTAWCIHPFPNGNGRHGRAFIDLLVRGTGAEPFTWGRDNLVAVGETCGRYIAALRAADAGDYGPLNEFVRT